MATKVTRQKKPVVFLKREHIVLTKELKAKVEARVKETIELAEKIWGFKLPMPDIRYDLKSRVAGMAYPAWNRLRFHPIFLVENERDYLTETVPHEVAHLLVPHIGPKIRAAMIKAGKLPKAVADKKFMSHGNEWQAIMLGLKRGPRKDQTWKDVIKHVYNPSSIDMPVRKKHGPRQPGGRKVGEILLRIKGLNEEELEALRQRLGAGFEIKLGEKERPPTPQEIQAAKEHHELMQLLRGEYNHWRPHDVASYAGWANNVITHLEVRA